MNFFQTLRSVFNRGNDSGKARSRGQKFRIPQRGAPVSARGYSPELCARAVSTWTVYGEKSAQLAAENRLAELNRDARSCTINTTADMRVCAKGFVRITGTQNALEGRAWRVKTVTFTLDGGGLKMNFNTDY